MCICKGEIERRREGRNREGGRKGREKMGERIKSFREEQSVR